MSAGTMMHLPDPRFDDREAPNSTRIEAQAKDHTVAANPDSSTVALSIEDGDGNEVTIFINTIAQARLIRLAAERAVEMAQDQHNKRVLQKLRGDAPALDAALKRGGE